MIRPIGHAPGLRLIPIHPAPAVAKRERPLRRGELWAQRVDREVTEEADHFLRCPACGTFDIRTSPRSSSMPAPCRIA
jgi:hypothetical protein